jgi:hypothetical protein
MFSVECLHGQAYAVGMNKLSIEERAKVIGYLLTNALSKKVENHKHMMAIYTMNYNFCRIHQTLRVTPAMEAGVSNHVWSLEKIVNLIEK